MRRPLPVTTTALCLAVGLGAGLASLPARAEERRLTEFPPWLEVAEFLLPDLRYAFRGALHDGALVLAWPLPLTLARRTIGQPERDLVPAECSGELCAPRWSLLPQVILEPQLRLGVVRPQGVIVARGTLLRAHAKASALLEVVATGDPSGAGGGFGVGLGLGGGLNLVYRSLWTPEGHRNDVSIDVPLFSLPMSRYVEEVSAARRDQMCVPGRPCSDRPSPSAFPDDRLPRSPFGRRPPDPPPDLAPDEQPRVPPPGDAPSGDTPPDDTPPGDAPPDDAPSDSPPRKSPGPAGRRPGRPGTLGAPAPLDARPAASRPGEWVRSLADGLSSR